MKMEFTESSISKEPEYIDERMNDPRAKKIEKISVFSGGRLGNRISIYMYNFLFNRHHGLPNFNYDQTIKYPLEPKNIKYQDPSPVPELLEYQYLLLAPGSQLVDKNLDGKHPYPHDVRFYQEYRSLLRDNILSKNLKPSGYDIAIHVRTDDIGNQSKCYTALPSSFYRDSLKDIIENNRNRYPLDIVIVAKKPHDSFTNKVLKAAVKVCKEIQLEYGSDVINKLNLQQNTVEKDFETLLTTPITIMSTSTFSYWATFLGQYCIETHVPGWGMMVDCWEHRDSILNGERSWTNINLDKWESEKFDDVPTKVVIHKLNTVKINAQTQNLLLEG